MDKPAGAGAKKIIQGTINERAFDEKVMKSKSNENFNDLKDDMTWIKWKLIGFVK